MPKGVSMIAREGLEQDRSEHAKLSVMALAARLQNIKQLKALLGRSFLCILGASWELLDFFWSSGGLLGAFWGCLEPSCGF